MALYGNSVTNPRVYLGMTNVLEKYDWLKNDDMLGVLSEAEFNSRLDRSVKEFTEDAEKYLLDVKTAKDKKQAMAQGFLLAGVGLYIAGSLLAIASPIAGIIVLVISIIASVVSIVKSVGASNDAKKLKDLKLQAIRIRSKAKDKKDNERIQRLIDMIDHEVESFYQDQPTQNINYNYNI